jgi:hypothetical protein
MLPPVPTARQLWKRWAMGWRSAAAESRWRRGRKWWAMGPCAATKRCACAGALTPGIHRSRIQVPRIAGPGGPPTPLIGLLLPEFHTPLPAGFVGHDAPTGEPQLFDIPIPEAKAAVQPDAITDEFSREAVISCSPFCGTSSRVWPSAEVVSATCTVRFSPRACSVIRWRSDRRRRAAAYWAGACHRPTLRVYRTLGGSAYADCTTRRTRSTVAGSESAASNLPSGRTHLPHGRF